MKLSYLEYFLTLAETLSFTETAARHFINQSALSRAIMQMEDDLGFQLFDRSKRNVTLTPAGQAFYTDCKELLMRYYTSVRNAKNVSLGLMGSISVISPLAIVEPLLIDITERFYAKYPGIHLVMRSFSTTELMHLFEAQTTDAAISYEKSPSDSFRSVALTEYKECVVVLPSHPLASRMSVSVKELQSENFVIMGRGYSSKGYDSIISKCRNAGFAPNIIDQANSVPHLLNMLVSYRCVTLLSDNYRSLAPAHYVFIPIEDVPPVKCYFSWNIHSENPSLPFLTDMILSEYASERPENNLPLPLSQGSAPEMSDSSSQETT